MEWQILLDEIQNDPLALGYSGMTDQQLLDSLSAQTRTVSRTLIPSHEIVSSVAPADWNALTDVQRETIKFIVSAGEVDVSASNVVNAFTNAFGAGTATRTALLAKVNMSASRLEELGLPSINLGDIQYVRSL